MCTAELVPLTTARKTIIPRRPNGRPVDPSTVWRWVRKGLAGVGSDRIKLPITYCGQSPYVTAEDVAEFFSRVTEAKTKRHSRTQAQAADVSDAELQAAGLA